MKIETDDALLFGSVGILALGAALVTAATTGALLLALGAGLMVFGLPATVIVFLASSEEPK